MLPDVLGRDALAVWENAFVSEQSLELPGLVHFPHDVTAAYELAFNVELRDGRPVCAFR